ncbi:MAG: ribonucleoside triphosphate reductase [Candidatus Pacebacteria bacterium]|nr:ribonucleoside triphosphate reductase [Candidatus Paceibacterota bacterium]
MAQATQSIQKIRKRDGTLAEFEQKKITLAIAKAMEASGQENREISQIVSDKVVQLLERRFREEQIPEVEQIQDIIEEVLILEEQVEAAKAFILYREQRRQIREAEVISDEAVEIFDKYISEMDWQVKENANMAYSLQGLNHYAVSVLTKRYWLNKIYPKYIREAYNSGDMHIHDLDCLATYCNGWDLYDLLLRGFGGVPGKVETSPAKHFRVALGQIVNFFYTLQGESAGAQAISSVDTLLAPFIRYDNLDYSQVKQAMQEFLFNCAVPTRVGFQTPFSNITLDIHPSLSFAKQPVIIGGKPQNETYAEFQEEMNMFNNAFFEVMMQGDKNGRPFTFPIPTINITKDFPWDDPKLDLMWQATAKYGISYFANFIQSEMKPEDVRSMCCRLRLNNKELYRRGGSLFGANPLTGSIGVITINLPRIGYLTKTKKEFFEKLAKIMDIAKDSLEMKRKALEDFMKKGLYPYSRVYLAGIEKMRGKYFGNHFATIGLVGLNESLLNFMGEDIGSKHGLSFSLEILDFMRERIIGYQKETDNLYNLEATPAEGTSYKLALKDKEKYPGIIQAGTSEAPYYTNSSQLPVNYTDDIFKALELQDELQCKYTGGTVAHLFLGEQISDIANMKGLIKKVFENFHLPYITLTPTFSICPAHGYLSGEHWKCPKCTVDQPCEVYSRVVGYIRPVMQWHKGKQQEFKERKTFAVPQTLEIKYENRGVAKINTD